VAGTGGFATPTLQLVPRSHCRGAIKKKKVKYKNKKRNRKKQANAGDKSFVVQSAGTKPCGRATVTGDLASLLPRSRSLNAIAR